MKYQDITFEHAFWKQLLELYDEWKECDMVGTISARAYTKISIEGLNLYIQNKQAWPQSGWVYFMDTNTSPQEGSMCHPHAFTIMSDVAKSLGVSLVTDAYCTYMMCRPSLMRPFIDWVENHLKPAVLAHPLSMTDSKYGAPRFTRDECMRRFGVPFYPHVPFVLERMTKIFFAHHDTTVDSKS